VVARSKVARARLTPEEHAAFLAEARAAGVSPSEYQRDLILGKIAAKDFTFRVESIERRLEHVETQLSEMWLREGQHDKKVT
jgi:hypothetical protein